jgi:capsular exopolysaccharide synthesis family protein
MADISKTLVNPTSHFAEPFRTLRLTLELRGDTESTRGVLVTSAEPGAGKSTTVANYALVAASGGASVLVVDGDLRKSVQHQIFGVARAPGLIELLAARGTLARHIQRSPFGVDVLAAGSPVPHGAEALASARMAAVLEEAAHAYDVVVVDSPPVLAAADAESLASGGRLDVVMVVDHSSRRRTVARALRRLKQVDAQIAGIALNRDVSVESYAYSY